MMLRQIKEKTRKRKKPWILIHFGASWEDISSHHFTFVFTPFMLEPPAVEMMSPWKLPTCGLLNKCAVCSGRSVRDQQPDFPEDNATGIISSTCCPGISVRLYTVIGVTKVELKFLFQAPSLLQESPAIKPSISWDAQPLSQCQDTWTRWKYLACVTQSRGKSGMGATYWEYKTRNMDCQKLGWKNEQELGNSYWRKVSVLEDRERLKSMCSTAQWQEYLL